MALSAAEQYLLELMNRARLDPQAECARFNIDINKDLAPGTLNTAVKQALAPNALLESAATRHSLWMLAQDVFSHTGASGSDPGSRIAAAGYQSTTWGENIAWYGATAAVTVESAVSTLNTNLFLSAVHRHNLLNGAFREIGLGAEAGGFVLGGVNYNSALVTQDFGSSSGTRYLTGVVYNDSNADDFYSIGEGSAGITFNISGKGSVTSSDAGGFSLNAGIDLATLVTGHIGTLNYSVLVNMSRGNVKLDVVDGSKFLSSGSITLVTGVVDVGLLGAAGLSATGNAAANELTGNAGSNFLSGQAGDDHIIGGKGNDTIRGGFGADTLFGGNDNDLLAGNRGADTFVFGAGSDNDRVHDFNMLQGDILLFDTTLWIGAKSSAQVVSQFAHIVAGEVVFDFGDGTVVHLSGISSLAGLDAFVHTF